MTRSVPVSHAGSLPRTPELIAANDARSIAADGFTLERTPEFDALLTTPSSTSCAASATSA